MLSLYTVKTFPRKRISFFAAHRSCIPRYNLENTNPFLFHKYFILSSTRMNKLKTN